jgi:hypothetical protein
LFGNSPAAKVAAARSQSPPSRAAAGAAVEARLLLARVPQPGRARHILFQRPAGHGMGPISAIIDSNIPQAFKEIDNGFTQL